MQVYIKRVIKYSCMFSLDLIKSNHAPFYRIQRSWNRQEYILLWCFVSPYLYWHLLLYVRIICLNIVSGDTLIKKIYLSILVWLYLSDALLRTLNPQICPMNFFNVTQKWPKMWVSSPDGSHSAQYLSKFHPNHKWIVSRKERCVCGGRD